ncbi:MAG: DUF393 domain-containing protein [Aureliella sp.]
MAELSHNLPSAEDRPGCDLVIWDGQCNFCLAQVKRLHQLDSGRLAYISLHNPRVAELAPSLDFDQLMSQMWVVSADGEKLGGVLHGGADAIRYLSRKLPWLWLAMPMLHIPGTAPLWRWAYNQVAKRRYKIAGKNCDDGGTCHLHNR